jgi:hypothetical protein
MVGADQRTGERFDLSHLRDPLSAGELQGLEGHLVRSQPDWRWQRYLAEKVKSERRLIVGKGRQIGVTWVALAVDVEEAITMPGTASLIYRQREGDAIDNVRRWWTLYQSLPKHFTSHIEVLKPDRSAQPSESGIELRFPNGDISEILPMTSAASSGHGRSVRRIIADEAAHIEKFSDIRAAIEPAAGDAAITIISTSHGRSNPETGEGNEFHRVWVGADEFGYDKVFLAYDVHPDRDEIWYESHPSVRSLKEMQRNEQFPRNEHEAFRLTAGTWFDSDDLIAYAELVRAPKMRLGMRTINSQKAEWEGNPKGCLKVYEFPRGGGDYAIGADACSGHGRDFAAAYVIDLSNMELAAEYHQKIEPDLFARDLHYLGRWFNDALIAVEDQGGYGTTVIIALRDGKAGRRPYPKLYRQVRATAPKQPIANAYGMPVTTRSRPLIVNGLGKAVRDRSLPFITNDLLLEMENFIDEPPVTSGNSRKGPWPRAADGFHDDRVLAACIVLEVYRQKGAHEETRPEKPPRKSTVPYPWMRKRKTKTRR